MYQLNGFFAGIPQLFQLLLKVCLGHWETSTFLLCEETLWRDLCRSLFLSAPFFYASLPGSQLSSVSQTCSRFLLATSLYLSSPPLWPFSIASSAASSLWWSISFCLLDLMGIVSVAFLLSTTQNRLIPPFSPTSSWWCFWASLRCCRGQCWPPPTLPVCRTLATWSTVFVPGSFPVQVAMGWVQVVHLCLALPLLRHGCWCLTDFGFCSAVELQLTDSACFSESSCRFEIPVDPSSGTLTFFIYSVSFK